MQQICASVDFKIISGCKRHIFLHMVMVQSLCCVRPFATPRIVARQFPLSVGFSRPDYWSRLPLPSLWDLPDPGIEPRFPELQADSLPFELQERSVCIYIYTHIYIHIYICVYIYTFLHKIQVIIHMEKWHNFKNNFYWRIDLPYCVNFRYTAIAQIFKAIKL